jgi:glycosyltransferase involved in cell wall biosynthesis
MKPYISIIIRLYNGIEYLNESVESVLAQTYPNWELLIGVNGHGSDGGDVFIQAKQIVESKNDSRIRLINYPNIKGGAAATNSLSGDANYEWVAFLDVDDKWHHRKLEAQVYALDNLNPTPDIVGTLCEYFGRMSGSPSIPSSYIHQDIFKEYNPMINSSILIRKNLVEFTEQFYGLDDYDLWCRLSLQDKIFFNIPNKLVYHRVHDGSCYNVSNKQYPDAVRDHYFGHGGTKN